MQRMHIHTPGWVHMHRPDWHTMGIHFGHLIHDPRFWAGFTLAVLFGLMVLAAILTKSTGGTTLTPTYPMYPYMP